MIHYQRGVRLERLACDRLREQGYTVTPHCAHAEGACVRSAGSKGAIDLAAFNDREVRLIQVKQQGALRPAERQALSALPVPRHTRVEIWARADGAWRVRRWNRRQPR